MDSVPDVSTLRAWIDAYDGELPEIISDIREWLQGIDPNVRHGSVAKRHTWWEIGSLTKKIYRARQAGDIEAADHFDAKRLRFIAQLQSSAAELSVVQGVTAPPGSPGAATALVHFAWATQFCEGGRPDVAEHSADWAQVNCPACLRSRPPVREESFEGKLTALLERATDLLAAKRAARPEKQQLVVDIASVLNGRPAPRRLLRSEPEVGDHSWDDNGVWKAPEGYPSLAGAAAKLNEVEFGRQEMASDLLHNFPGHVAKIVQPLIDNLQGTHLKRIMRLV